MVISKGSIACAFALALIGTGAPAVRADGVLEKMQTEVAAITERIRNAVVLIEDERAVARYAEPLFLSDPFNDWRAKSFAFETERKALLERQEALKREIASGKAKKTAETDAEIKETEQRLALIAMALKKQEAEMRLLDKNYSATKLLAPRLSQELSELYGQIAKLPEAVLSGKTGEKSTEELSKAMALSEAAFAKLQELDVQMDVIGRLNQSDPAIANLRQKREEITKRLKGFAKAYAENRAAVNVQNAPPPKDVTTGRKNFPEELSIIVQGGLVKEALPAKAGDAYSIGVAGAPLRSGSGFSIGDGYILTTSDVLADMKNPVVITDSGMRIKAQVVGRNEDLNIGLVRITAKIELPSLKMGDSATVKAGHFAISVGNQGGQGNTTALMLVGGVLNEGTYSGRQFYPSLIQIAGTVGAGTSGAPVVNVQGEVIGMMASVPVRNRVYRASSQATTPANPPMDTPGFPTIAPSVTLPALPAAPPQPSIRAGGASKESPQRSVTDRANGVFVRPNAFFAAEPLGSSNAGFAIPINHIKPIIEELRSDKPIVKGWIGIAPEDYRVTSEKDNVIRIEQSVRVVGVYPDSPAFASGIQPGDILVAINEKPIRNAADVREVSVRLRKGDTLVVSVKRGVELRHTKMKIDARPQTIKPPITLVPKEIR